MKWLLDIPKKLHVFWAGGSLPYLRYLTVKTFKRFNPGWQVNLWTSQFRSQVRTWNTFELSYSDTWKDYTDKLLRECDNIFAIDFEMFGVKNTISEVHKSDLLRYWILYNEGGVYCDTDILYFRPITELRVNKAENKKVKTFVCIGKYGHSNGFMMSVKGSNFYRIMFENAKESDLMKYQSNGPDLCNKLFPTIESITDISTVENIDMDAVYFYDGQHINEIYGPIEPIFHQNSVGCHWYAGHPLAGIFLKNTNGGLTHLPDTLIGNLCKSLS